MDVEKEFVKVYKLLKNNATTIYVSEILDNIENSEVLFLPPDRLPTKHLYLVYRDRFNIQQNVIKRDLTDGWEYTLRNLLNENEVDSCVASITTGTASYAVFTSVSIDRIIGILKSKNHNIERARELRGVYAERKLPTSSRRFVRRVLQQD